MKKMLLFISLSFIYFAICVAAANSQTTAVTATVVDSDSTVWANATWTLSFQVGSHQSNPAAYTIGGSPLSQSVAYQTGTANGSGVITFTTYQSTAISPIGSSWYFTVCPQASVPCTTINFITSASTLSLSSAINTAIVAPRFTARANSIGYNDTEAQITLVTGATYFNTTSNIQRCYTGSIWGACSTGSGSQTWPATPGITVCTGTPCTAWGTSLTAPSGTIVGTIDTQTLTNKTIDGVSPATMAFVDPTSSIQTQLNSKQASIGYTPTNAAVVPSTVPTSAQILVGNIGGTAYAPVSMSGDGTLASTGALTFATVNSNIGTCGDATHVGQVTLNAKGLATACTPVSITATTVTIASGTSALGTGAISSATCATVVTTTATGVATTDTIGWGFNGDPTAVTGYIPAVAGMLTIIAYPSSGNVNFKVCNNTSGSIIPGTITLNWRVVR
jgi:hypothetical protein